MKPTLETFERVRQAFGPCSTIYECCSAKDLLLDYEEHSERNPDDGLAEWIELQAKVEGIYWERDLEAKNLGGCYTDEELVARIEEDDTFSAGIRQRINKLLEEMEC